MKDRTTYLVTHAEETRGMSDGPSSFIPSIGAATTAVDQYRAIAVSTTNLPELGAAFTDTNAVRALSLVAEGGLSSADDLNAAETALQALLLHEIVHVVTAAPKLDRGDGLIAYCRFDAGDRSKLGFELFAKAHSRDFIIAPEFLQIDNGKVASATFDNSPLLGADENELASLAENWNEFTVDAVNAMIEGHSIPAYLTAPGLVKARRGDGFAKSFYHKLGISWNKATGSIPPIVCTFSLPPLLAIVLDRMNNREDLSATLDELREELVPVRRELLELNQVVISARDQASVERKVRYVEQSFDSIVPSSRRTNAERFQRKLASIQTLVRPVLKFMAGFVVRTGVSQAEVEAAAGGALDYVIESERAIDRTVTAKTFAGLMNTDSIQSLVQHHFTETEIRAIERSLL